VSAGSDGGEPAVELPSDVLEALEAQEWRREVARLQAEETERERAVTKAKRFFILMMLS